MHPAATCGAGGDAVPLPMRVVHVSHDMEAIARVFSPAKALEAVRERRDRTYDPALADRMAHDRADRAAFAPEAAAAELQRLAAAGTLDPRATEAVLAAAGHGGPDGPKRRRTEHPGALSDREVDVLRLAARGLKTKEIAEQLFISPKTADHHIQHIYNKIGVSTRAAAALWAAERAVVN